MVTLRIDPPKPLPPKLQAVLVRLAKAASSLNITHAVKLPYLVDVIANRVLGKPITEGHHEAWTHGVVTSEAWHYLTHAEVDPGSVFSVEPVPFSEEKRITLLVPDADEDELSDAERRVVDYAISEFMNVWAKDLGEMTKIMNPAIRRWGTNKPADIGLDAYDRMSAEYQAMSRLASSWTLDRMRRSSEPLGDVEDAIA